MKKYLLPEKGEFYKVNLHCHTSLSDGRLSPEEVKAHYKSQGYSAVAFTDHDIFLRHPELCDDEFIALNGYEMEINQKSDETDKPYRKCCHICLVALTPDIKEQVCWHREKYLFSNAPLYKDEIVFDESLPDFERRYSPECINEIYRRGREGGFFVTYNHPVWSLEDYSDYINYDGMHAMEIVNYSCQCAGYPEYNAKIFDDMLREGKKVYCVAADDNHGTADRCGGFVMVKAEKLGYTELTDALVRGDFYASEGPEIKALWYEDGKIFVECSAARQICFCLGTRKTRSIRMVDAPLTGGEFELPENYDYVRVSVIDEQGRHADTQAYYQKDLQK